MAEFFQGSVHIPRHGDINIALVVVPIKGEAAVESSGPINCEVVVGLDGLDKIHGIRLGEVFDAKIVDAKDKRGAFCAVTPEAWHEWHGFIAQWC